MRTSLCTLLFLGLLGLACGDGTGPVHSAPFYSARLDGQPWPSDTAIALAFGAPTDTTLSVTAARTVSLAEEEEISFSVRGFLRTLSAGSTLALASGAALTPDHPGDSNTIRFKDDAQLLRAHRAEIRRVLDSTLSRVAGALDLTEVTVTVSPGSGIPGYGMGGYTPTGRDVQISIDPAYPDLGTLLSVRLPPLLAHELHHARRWRGPGYGRTLLEAFVSEGLADHFAMELLGATIPPWSDAFPRSQTTQFLQLARAEFASTTYDHARWFFGAAPPPPRWTGYTLGFRLVERYQSDHPGTTAAQLVDAPADLFRR